MSIFSITISYFIGIIGGPIFKHKMVPLFFLLFLGINIRNHYKGKKTIPFRKFFLLLIIATISNIQYLQKETSFQNLHQIILQGETSQEVKGIGKIISDPQKKTYKTNYQLKVEKLEVKGKQINIRKTILLQVKKQNTDFKWGDTISFTGSWEKITTQRNQGGFNYEQYLKIQGISGIITTEESQIKFQKEQTNFSIDFMVHQVKETIRATIKTLLPQEESSLIIGILLGDTAEITPQTKEDFRNSNLSHMLAVSGSHTGYVIVGITLLFKKLKIGTRKTIYISILFLFFFCLLTGSTPSVERASFMAIYRNGSTIML